jgi:hypothetical protein
VSLFTNFVIVTVQGRFKEKSLSSRKRTTFAYCLSICDPETCDDWRQLQCINYRSCLYLFTSGPELGAAEACLYISSARELSDTRLTSHSIQRGERTVRSGRWEIEKEHLRYTIVRRVNCVLYPQDRGNYTSRHRTWMKYKFILSESFMCTELISIVVCVGSKLTRQLIMILFYCYRNVKLSE